MLPTLTPLIGIIARERTTTNPSLYDDARQEGLIAAWRTSTTHPDASPAYLTTSARNAVLDVVRGRPMTGQEGRRGWRDAASDADSLDYGDGAHDHTPDPTADDALDAVLDRVHAADVREAVATLPASDAALVHLRFAQDRTWPEVAVAVGKRTEAVRRRFADHIAPALRAELAHLAPAVSNA